MARAGGAAAGRGDAISSDSSCGADDGVRGRGQRDHCVRAGLRGRQRPRLLERAGAFAGWPSRGGWRGARHAGAPPAAMASSAASMSGGKLEAGRRQIFAQMLDRRGARNEQDVGRALQEPGERDLHRRRAAPPGDIVERRRLQRREAAEREERHIGDAVRGRGRRSARRRRDGRHCSGSARRRCRRSGAPPRSAPA